MWIWTTHTRVCRLNVYTLFGRYVQSIYFLFPNPSNSIRENSHGKAKTLLFWCNRFWWCKSRFSLVKRCEHVEHQLSDKYAKSAAHFSLWANKPKPKYSNASNWTNERASISRKHFFAQVMDIHMSIFGQSAVSYVQRKKLVYSIIRTQAPRSSLHSAHSVELQLPKLI